MTTENTGLTLPLSRSLDLQDLTKHRAMVAFELEVLAKKFDRFGWERDRGTAAHDRLVTDWMDELQDFPLDEVRSAVRDALRDEPGKMPNEWHIVTKIMEARRRAYVPKPLPPEPERERISKQAATDALIAAGFLPKRM